MAFPEEELIQKDQTIFFSNLGIEYHCLNNISKIIQIKSATDMEIIESIVESMMIAEASWVSLLS
jgi:hypothetical protein